MQNKLKTLDEFDLYLKKSNQQPLLVKFHTSWCSPCRELQKELDKLLIEQPDLSVLEVDAEEFFPLSQKFEVQGVPFLLLFLKEKKIKEGRGYMNLSTLREFVKI